MYCSAHGLGSEVNDSKVPRGRFRMPSNSSPESIAVVKKHSTVRAPVGVVGKDSRWLWRGGPVGLRICRVDEPPRGSVLTCVTTPTRRAV